MDPLTPLIILLISSGSLLIGFCLGKLWSDADE